MGIEITYRRIPRAEFEILQADPKKAKEFVCSVLPGFNLEDLMALGDNPGAMRDRGADILAAFQKREVDPYRVDLEKDWHALHFLLTGDSSMETVHRPEQPLHNVVMGGHEANFQTGYGPARLISRPPKLIRVSRMIGYSARQLRTTQLRFTISLAGSTAPQAGRQVRITIALCS